MSKRKIVITIDCNAKTCGGCVYYSNGYCDVFIYTEHDGRRDPECIAAEVKRD